jgi:predicted dehydrogenase
MGLQHARALRLSGAAELVACVDPDESARARFLDYAGSPTVGYSDLNRMVDAETPDVVIVATTTRWHAKVTTAALELGCHVVCEKPIAATLAEGDRMLAVADAADRRLLINNEYNVHPRTRAALRAVAEGSIGELLTMHGRFKGRFVGGFDLAEGSPHLFSLAQLFAGEPRSVSARFVTQQALSTRANVFAGSRLNTLDGGWLLGDQVFVGVQLDRGVFLHAEFLDRRTTPSILLTGDKGAVFLPYGATPRPALITTDPTDPFAEWTPLEIEMPESVSASQPLGGDPDAVYTVLNGQATAIASISWAEWFSSGAQGQHPLNARQALRSLEVIHGAYRSHIAESGGWASLPLGDRDHGLNEWVPR